MNAVLWKDLIAGYSLNLDRSVEPKKINIWRFIIVDVRLHVEYECLSACLSGPSPDRSDEGIPQTAGATSRG